MNTTVASRFVLSFVLIAVLSVGFGCRSKQAMTDGEMTGSDLLDPTALDGNYALGPRGEFGQPVSEAEFQTENVLFSYDSFQIPPSERIKIEAVAEFMLDNPETTVLVDGHCDERGSREYNLSLGEHRALSIRAILISLGVAGDRIQTRSFGSEMPLDPASNESAWRLNRRGEFSLFRP
jgi:outer membrane protein OmpA-like peptidoglycan-associated protein